MISRGMVAVVTICLGVVLLVSPSSVSAAGDPPPSAKAPLPARAYAGLACNPFDSKLRGTALANGVGPEARVAAACMRLEWIARRSVAVPTITVYASKTFPASRIKRLNQAVAAGHRLFGASANVDRYLVLASREAAYSCAKGAQIIEGRLVYSQGIRSWAQTYNSGCPGTDYSPSGWTSTILDPGGRTYFAWTLTGPDSNDHFTGDLPLGPMWFLGAVSHEFAHSIQMQRSMESTNGQESIGRWFGEGQAQYLGNTAAAYTIGPANIRSLQLQQLRDVMRHEGVRTIDLAALEDNWSTQLVYPAGYFAYEWMVAHYGLAATFKWWNAWNSACERPGSSICWKEKAPQMFGMTDTELIATLNDYVNAQVKG